MIPLKFLRENLDLIVKNCQVRNFKFDANSFIQKEKERLKLLKYNEEKKALMNKHTKEIGLQKKIGIDLNVNLQKKMKNFSDEIRANDSKLRKIEEEVYHIAMSLPNIIDFDVPSKFSQADNQLIRKWGDIPNFSFPVLDHTAILEKNNWVDFEKATNITGSRFVILKGEILKLQRALIQFLILENIQKGYLEVSPPSIVNSKTLEGTGQLPKFKEDLFFLAGDFKHYALIPTAEVPLTNFYQNTILVDSELPIYFTAVTPCFRSEAGSAGKDNKGLIRLHEFSKVELVKIVNPNHSKQEHQSMVSHVESLLQKLHLPYRVMLLCSGDTGFSAQKCYDLEVWLPGENTYREISSCSNCGAFQAHRMKTRFRQPDGKIDFVHTLNGSALPIGRTMVAIVENYQKKDGSIKIPEVLKKYYL